MIRTAVGAVVLAAGQSRRMGRPKMVLPWGATTVIGQVAATLAGALVSPIVVVTGGDEALVKEALKDGPVIWVHNPYYRQSEMLVSLQAGLKAMPATVTGALVCLGDQPQIERGVVEALLTRFRESGKSLIVPSFQMRRGHPWLAARNLWGDILAMDMNSNLRDFMRNHESDIDYLNVASASILKDLDTPDDYAAEAPKG